MKLTLFIPLFAVFSALNLRAQSSYPQITIGPSYDYSLLQVSQGGLINGCNGFGIGIFSEKNTSVNNNYISLQFGIIYSYRSIQDYKSEPYYPTLQRVIHLNSNINQHVIKTQLMTKYRLEQSRFSFGAGANISFILLSTINQTNSEPFDSATYQRIQYNYNRKDDTGIHTYNRFNIAPTFNIGFKVSEKIDLEYFIGYDLIAPAQKYTNYEVYRLLNNSIFLTFKIN
jgi:hypothetical protein